MTDPAPPAPLPPHPAPPAQATPQPWAAPAAPPFGAPPSQPAQGVYAPPPGYTGPYVPAAGGVAAPAQPRGRGLGLVALIAALGAAILAPIVAAAATFSIGLGAGREIAINRMDIDFDWSVLTPVRDWVLVAEISFWAGTALGVWALVQGAIAIITNRGRGLGIAAVAVAIAGVIIFAVVVQGFLAAGLAAGSGIGG